MSNLIEQLLESGLPSRDVQVGLSDASGIGETIIATQSNYKNLNCTANIKLADEDINVSNPLYVAISSGSAAIDGVTPGVGSTSLGKTEDAPHTSGDVGVMMLGVRNDSLAALADTNKDYAPLQVNSTGALYCDVTAVVPGTGATSLGKAEDAQHVSGDTGVMALAVRNDTLAALATTSKDYAPLQVNANGALYCACDVTSIVPGTSATSLGKAEDSQHTSGDTGVMALAVRTDTLTTLATTKYDYTPLQVNSIGALFTTGGDTIGTATNDNVMLIGGYATKTTSQTSVIEGGAIALACDEQGRVITTASPRSAIIKDIKILTSSTAETTVLSAAGLGLYIDVTMIVIANSDVATDDTVSIRDATAGTAVMTLQVARNSTVVVNMGHAPFPQTASNANWTVQCAAGTNAMYVTMAGIQRGDAV